MARTIYADARKALSELNSKMRDMMDIAKIPDGGLLDRRIQGALSELYEAIHDPRIARNASLRKSRVKVYPVAGRDMRFWFTSDGRRAQSLLTGRRASRVASAARVTPLPEDQPSRPITARQYIKLFDDAIVTERSHNGEYEFSQSFV